MTADQYDIYTIALPLGSTYGNIYYLAQVKITDGIKYNNSP